MADANGSGTPAPPEDSDPDRTQRIPGIQAVVDKWFGNDQPATEQGQPMRVWNRKARRMNEQHAQGQPTTGRRGCPLVLAPVVLAVVLAGWAVR